MTSGRNTCLRQDHAIFCHRIVAVLIDLVPGSSFAISLDFLAPRATEFRDAATVVAIPTSSQVPKVAVTALALCPPLAYRRGMRIT
jgi:hypothetical protein